MGKSVSQISNAANALNVIQFLFTNLKIEKDMFP